MGELEESIQELLGEGRTPMHIRMELIHRGFLEEEVDRALNTSTTVRRSAQERRTNRWLTARELLDRFGYGFATPQFVNILFLQSGAGLFLI